jgi:hypothetical protein
VDRTLTAVGRHGPAVLVRAVLVRADLVRAGAAKAPAAPGASWGAIVAQIAIWAAIAGGVAGLIAVIPQTRRATVRTWRALMTMVGVPYRHYARKFTEKHRSYPNPYLDQYEDLDLRSTYVPLSFQAGDGQDLALASQVLAHLAASRAIIVGDPGSGKSTLLKAYGVGVLHGRHVLSRRRRIVPYFVQLRVLARYLAPGHGIADYIADEILVRGGVFRPDQAKAFLARTFAQRQALVLLDGLDEVPDALQQDVLAAVLSFTRDESLDRPTARATVLLTCRSQNFRSLRETWVPVFARADQQYTLAPFRDVEIMNYLRRFPGKFRTADGPARFMKAARDTKTLDLLRAPLVLAMAVGSYAHRPTELPSTVAELYESMIKEMLDRNSFRREDPENSVLRYLVSDKYRFLRQFSLFAIEQTGEFSEFARALLDDYAATLADKLSAVDNPAGMVTEIIQRSSLLSYVGDDAGPDNADRQLFVFAHRSIQEFLTAQELRMPGRDGDAFLLERASDLTWRQAILFYTAGQEADSVDGFLRELARRDSDLAAYCLQGALPSDSAAAEVLDALKPVTEARIGALAAVTRSPRQRVQQMGVDQLKAFIADSVDALSASGTGIDALMPLLESLAMTNAGEIAAFVPQIIGNLPDDPRLVGPLWRTLGADGIELHRAACAEIVQRLLALTMEPDSFAELARQDPLDPYFLTDVRSRAYPFRASHALTADHNQVTLLAWAEYLGVTPVQPNRFFEARIAGHLDRVETARRRTISLSLYWPARVVSGLIFTVVAVTDTYIFAKAPGLLMNPYGWKTLLLVLLGGYFGSAIPYFVLASISESIPDTSPRKRYLGGLSVAKSTLVHLGTGNFLSLIPEKIRTAGGSPGGAGFDEGLQVFMLVLVPIAAAPLLKVSVAWFLVVAIAGAPLYLLTNLNAFGSDVRYYPYRPSEFVDMYDDPRSRHWLGLAGQF